MLPDTGLSCCQCASCCRVLFLLLYAATVAHLFQQGLNRVFEVVIGRELVDGAVPVVGTKQQDNALNTCSQPADATVVQAL